MSLPGIFQTDLATIPAKVPYLSAAAELVNKWRGVLGEKRGLRVGIAWQGSRDFAGDRFRSIPLAQFAPLAAVEGVELVSLQKGYGAEQLADAPLRRAEFRQSARRVRQGLHRYRRRHPKPRSRDHLRHGDRSPGRRLAAPVWVALSFAPDWRWLLDRPDSPWYPTMRLFRQSQLEDWTGVFQTMAGELARFAAEKSRA